VLGFVVLGAGATISALAFSPVSLFGARFLAGAGAGIYFPVSVGLLAANTSPERRATRVGLLVSLGLAVGGSIGFLGGALVGARFGWEILLGGLGLVGLLGAAL